MAKYVEEIRKEAAKWNEVAEDVTESECCNSKKEITEAHKTASAQLFK